MRNRFLGKFFDIWLIVRVPGSVHNTLQMTDKTFDEVAGPHSHNPKLSHTHITLTHTPTHTTHTHTAQTGSGFFHLLAIEPKKTSLQFG